MPGVDILATAFNGANAAFIADLYARWVRDPASVDPSFGTLFEALNDEERLVLTDASGASWAPRHWEIEADGPASAPAGKKAEAGAKASPGIPASRAEAAEHAHDDTINSIRALMLIRSYRVRGHLAAKLDPLGQQERRKNPELDPATYGFTAADYDKPIFIDNLLGRQTATLQEILNILQETYCGHIGIEFMHMQDMAQKDWLQRRIENSSWRAQISAEIKTQLLQELTEAEAFEAFCQKRFVGTKRFGLEGGESTIPALHTIIRTAARDAVSEIVIGMAHRGRLNTLVNVVKKPFTAVFSEFGGASSKPDDVQGSGDVKYHLGTSTDLEIEGRKVHLSLQPNPSHLEVVDPVVVGKVRARQDEAGDTRGRRSVMGILLHGDAAFAGQGIVYETLAMSQLIGYRTGGTVHVITNNQIGFTTIPAHAYSGLYCTDVAKSVQSPILHVNGDDPEAVYFAAKLLTEFRQEFGSDVVLDIVCYRRHGHNEADEPAFTQPIMYRAIDQLRTTRTLYAAKLVAEGVLSEAGAKGIWDKFTTKLEEAFEAGKSYRPNKADWLEGKWTGLNRGEDDETRSEETTGVALDTLREVGAAISRVPADFNVNPKIARQLEAKKVASETGEGIDWATGEALAYGTLLLDGHRVRLSGEDCQRGTFSQRHAVLIDQTNQNEYTPLNNIRDGQTKIEIYNSLLSEVGVLGFEYGYSVADPKTLVLWEAQFGDFANGAQAVIDQFIASGETKWLRMSGLTLLLPHGQEGQGPEHSSARLERYLQLCAENNMQVCNITTPGNYFHALRRQMKRNYRKPLVIMTPKSLLRHKLAVSPLSEMAEGTSFRKVIGEVDTLVDNEKVRRVVISTGKVYYDLLAARRERAIDDVALIRLEQIYPFPAMGLRTLLQSYPNAEVVWCQEEPENSGAWTFVDRRLERVLVAIDAPSKRPRYVGREEAASPATGSAKVHANQQAALVAAALQ
ncbi:2-oxoglutarate dehydrogenase E1 component [Acidisoma silvae]|uniref:2-oxoglutarate dehydrogenase E1 component n=1 Tax=Acidisoma silvae TaxID=2802396 RepID=A0A963YTC7_9PROT|nr:2-oxoglutarate dehydrogenase E1 component [Acidisoma silvae]MCB8876640.1 2-oxoglutarate dehydrogenase E1 component [Acidisoma silvae]